MDLHASEIRVLGCLLEKQRATPEHYPLTLNALRLACNQSTNRDPVVEYSDADVREAVRRLERRGMARFAGGAGSRAPKYRHLLAESLPMDDAEQALICVLMLRGPQTPGELKQRSERLHSFGSLAEVHETLVRLIDRELVACIGRRRGQKEERYADLLGDRSSAGLISDQPPSSASRPASAYQPPAAHRPPFVTEPTSPHEPVSTHEPASPDELVDGHDRPSLAGATAILADRVARLERELAHLQEQLGVEPAGGEGDHLVEAGDGDQLPQAGGVGDHLVEAGDGDQLPQAGGEGGHLAEAGDGGGGWRS